ncbi:MAG TPA: SDR family NAD(P)-dependent oxidoreductase [Polyangiaceae bacterium]|jgi:NAD(P)-dependent dehydrogenase (short-subunit alcohol dehydrogenase family)
MTDVALVTGAAGALGSEVARTLAARGHKLALVDVARGEERLKQLAASLGGACVVTGDIAVEATWAEAMLRIERELGAPPTLAALVAGGWAGGKALHEETSDDVWNGMMQANLATVHRSLRALLPPMVARKRGSIVVIGSRAAVSPETSAHAAAYAASKAAVVALARAVSVEVVNDGVRVNAVLPSTLDTPANRASMPKADPTKWVSLPSAAGVVAFLLSDDARDVSGAALPVYGRA